MSASASEPWHAGLIACTHGAHWRGALLRGPSGVGKSDLALRAVAAGWRLVADDRVIGWRSGARLFGRAPAALHGLCEARGQAVLTLAALAFAPIDLVVDLAGPNAELERQPAAGMVILEGVVTPHIVLAAREASAVARLNRALARVHAMSAHTV